ncbi:hypothetical protein CCU_19140 [Coprococcus sp. ART55/1]|uniref:hypothetical protein n=1 Tax=Coprococcus sp. ART55/1 TaxID=751585 RepID=UPI0001CCDA47|nr:hypothetical protein [Coprococcus sp. ART55/1]CBK83393.1 hypothetical protein CCU_19140 [Coprococcus sp. ART55/1]
MDEQNRVEDIDRVDGGSTSEQNLEQEKAMMAENSQVAQPAQSLYQHMPQYGQPVQQMPQYGQPAQQPYQPQSQYSQGAQPMQTPYQQMPQYGQPAQQPYQPQSQSQYSQGAQPMQTPYQQMPQYGQPTQQPYQPQSQYGQPVQPTPYNNPMGYMGYENRQNIPDDVKKGSTHVPNMLNLIGIIMAVVSVFIPYAYMGTDARSIVGVFGINVLSMLVAAVVIIADVICAFINKAGCYIADLVISIVVGGILIFEFVLSLIDLGKLDAAASARLGVGAWISVAAALFMLISVPIWWTISRKKDKAEKQD